VLLRAVPAHDLPRLTDLWVESWASLELDIDFEARRAWLPEHLQSLVAGGAALVGVYAPELAGFVTINPATGWLDQICVAPRHFGSGAALALMNEAKRLAHHRVELDVVEANPRAIRFYEREGFKTIGFGVSPRSGLKTRLMRWERQLSG